MHKATKELINESIDYILLHLNDNLKASHIAEHFHYSEFYFERIFKAVTGQSMYAFIKHLKMDQSAIDLKLKQCKSITTIGLDYGYSASNYSTAFKKEKAISPIQFREKNVAENIINPFQLQKIERLKTFESYHSNIHIVELTDMIVLYERVYGDYSNIKEKWLGLFETYKQYIELDTVMVERFYSDPSISSQNNCICDLCISIDKDCDLANVTTLKGGKFAIYPYKGTIADIFHTLQGMFTVYLTNSKYEMTERYGLSIYREIDVIHDFVAIDFCIPIK